MTIKIVKVVETCMGCPSQWDAWDDEGRYYYLRYRFGKASIEGYDNPEFYNEDDPKTHYENYWTYGDSLDGCISLDEFAKQGGLDVSRAEIVPYDLGL